MVEINYFGFEREDDWATDLIVGDKYSVDPNIDRVNGLQGRSIKQTGSNDVRLGSLSDITNTSSNYILGVWFKLVDLPPKGGNNISNQIFRLYNSVEGSEIRLGKWINIGTAPDYEVELTTTSPPNSGGTSIRYEIFEDQWHLILIGVDHTNDTLEFSFDGQNFSNDGFTLSTAYDFSNRSFRIFEFGSGNEAKGVIDSVFVLKDNPTDTIATNLYNSGNGRSPERTGVSGLHTVNNTLTSGGRFVAVNEDDEVVEGTASADNDGVFVITDIPANKRYSVVAEYDDGTNKYHDNSWTYRGDYT